MSINRILLVLPEPPIPFGGAAARWFHVVLSELARRGCRVTVLCCSGGVKADHEAQDLHGRSAELNFFPAKPRSILGKFSSAMYPYSYPYSQQMVVALQRQLSQSWDLIRFETHFAAWLIKKPPITAELNVHQLYSIDRLYDKCSVFSPRSRILRQRVLQSEIHLIRRFRRVSALTDRLAEEIRRLHPAAEVRVTPMTIDESLYTIRDRTFPSPKPSPTVGLIGSFNWMPTHLAGRVLVERIWPTVKKRLPEAKLLLVGRSAKTVFADVLDSSDIEVHSDVPDTIPFFKRLDCMVYLPSVGSGMKVKVLEAIALGVPVVTNAEGAEGLPASVAASVAYDNVEAAVDRVVGLLSGVVSRETCVLWEELFAELSPTRCVEGMLANLVPPCRHGPLRHLGVLS